MTEYIEKQPLMQAIRTLPTWFCDPGAKYFDGPQPPMEALLDPDEVIQTIAGTPSADAVEVVRCKDCLIHGLCRFEQGLGLDGFCSKGERKDG